MYETNHQVRRPAAGPGAAVRRVVLESAGLFDILADAGMLVLHSAYIVTRQGEGILFSGPSGIGKSTQAALWQHYGAAQTVNGDRALVRKDFRYLLTELKKMGLLVSVNSNGSLIDRDWLDFSGTSRRSASTSPSTGPAMPPMSGCAAVPCLPGSRRISGPCGSWAWG